MFYRILLFALLINQTVFAQSGVSDQLRTEIDKIIRFDTEIDMKKTPGFMIGVIDGANTYKYNYGRRSLKSNEACNYDELYEIGSCTKLFTSLLLQKLVAKGLVDLNKPINSYLDIEYENPRMEIVTIGDLINHMSGLPKRPAKFGKYDKNAGQPYLLFSKEELIKYYRDFIPEKKKTKYIYSHTNYALLEIIIESVTGMAIEDALQEYVSKPLGLKNTHFDLGENMVDLIAPGYDRAMKLADPWIFASFKGSEGIKLSLIDAMATMQFFIDQNKNLIESQLRPGLNDQLKMYNGWHVKRVNKTSFIYVHTGQTNGHTAFMAMLPDTETAVIVISNSKYGTEDLGMQILRMINYNWNRKSII